MRHRQGDSQPCSAFQARTNFRAQARARGTVPNSVVKNVSFAFANVSFKPDQVRVIDLSGISTPKDRQLKGILGYDFFCAMSSFWITTSQRCRSTIRRRLSIAERKKSCRSFSKGMFHL